MQIILEFSEQVLSDLCSKAASQGVTLSELITRTVLGSSSQEDPLSSLVKEGTIQPVSCGQSVMTDCTPKFYTHPVPKGRVKFDVSSYPVEDTNTNDALPSLASLNGEDESEGENIEVEVIEIDPDAPEVDSGDEWLF